jgi:hypothetical protein
MSEQILLLNPRRKHKRRKNPRRGRMPAGLARYWAGRRGHHYRASNPSKRRRRRRHHARAPNRRRGHHYQARHHRRTNRRRTHHKRRHNRRSFGGLGRIRGLGRGVIGQYVIPGAIGGGGALLLDVIWGYAAPKLPAQVQTGWFGLAAKLGVVIGAAMLANRFVPRLRSQTHRAAVGAATVLAYGAIKGVAQGILPAGTPGLSGYIDYQSYSLPVSRGGMHGYMPPRTLGGLGDDLYSPAAVIQPPGTPVPRQFGGYIATQPNNLNGYIAQQPHVGGAGGLMGYDWQNDGM